MSEGQQMSEPMEDESHEVQAQDNEGEQDNAIEEPYIQDYPYEQEEPEPDDYLDYQHQLQLPTRSKSCAGNSQYDIKDLRDNIIKQAKDINQLTNLGFDWSIYLLSCSGWSKDFISNMLTAADEKHKKLINYDPKLEQKQPSVGQGQCMICGQQKVQILRNLCGHEFCCNCWSGHIEYRLTTQFRDPFPPCMYDNCSIKVSFSLLQELSKISNEIKDKFYDVLCRSYAFYNKSVKICKGKPGVSCNRCFKVKILFDPIECNTCGNFVCLRCGQQYHGQCQCFYLNNFKRLTQDSTQFIEQLGYKMCPHCKEVVERKQGCNSMICKCKQQFCYVCGEKWAPNHTAHGDETCYRYKQIQVLKQEKEKQKLNKKEYFQKAQERLAKLDSLNKRFTRLETLKRTQLNKIIECFLKNFGFYKTKLMCISQYITFLQRGYCVLWGEILSLHFKVDKQKQAYCKVLQNDLQELNKFIIDQIEYMYKILQKQPKDLTKKQLELITYQAKVKFQDDFLEKIKKFHDELPKMQKYITVFDYQSS